MFGRPGAFAGLEELEEEFEEELDDLVLERRESSYGAAATRQKVRWYQVILRLTGAHEVPVNGNHNDPKTREALRRFQERHGLSPTGYLTVRTNSALIRVALEWISGERIRNRPGQSSVHLRDAIRRFQREYHLVVDGKVGSQVRQVMMEVLLGVRPSLRTDHHFRLGKLSAAAAGGTLDDLTPGRRYTDFAEPSTVLSLESAERSAFRNNREIVLTSLGDAEPVPNPWRRGFRVICLLIIQFRHPTTKEVRFAPATGFLVSPRHVATAAHVMLNLTRVGGRDRLFYAERIAVVPGFTWPSRLRVCRDKARKHCLDTKRPFGWVVVDRRGFNTPTDFVQVVPSVGTDARLTADNNLDYGLLDLGTTMGKATMRYVDPDDGKLYKAKLGWWGADSGMTSKAFPRTTDLDGKSIFIAGYPLAFGGQQVYSPGTVDISEQITAGGVIGALARETGPNEFVHTADTIGGHSGSPVWQAMRSGAWRLLGIDTQAFTRSAFPSVLGRVENIEGGIAWNLDVLADMKRWMSKPNWRTK